jgi:hypothetical protein
LDNPDAQFIADILEAVRRHSDLAGKAVWRAGKDENGDVGEPALAVLRALGTLSSDEVGELIVRLRAL